MHSHVDSDLLQHRRNFVPRARDVSDLEVFGNFHIHDADALQRGLIVVSAGQILASDQRVAFAVILAARGQHRANLGVSFFQAARERL